MTLEELTQSLLHLRHSGWNDFSVYVRVDDGSVRNIKDISAVPNCKVLQKTDDHPWPLGGGIYFGTEL